MAIPALDPAHVTAIPEDPSRPLAASERHWHLLHTRGAMVCAQALRLRARLPAPLLADALAALQRRHPLLRVHIPAGGALRFEATGTTAVPLTVVRREDEHHWRREMEAALHRPLPTGPEPRLRVRLLAPDAGDRCEVVVGWDHAVMDALSMVAFGRDLLEACSVLARGGALRPDWALPAHPPLDAVLPGVAERGGTGLAEMRRVIAQLAGSRFPLATTERSPTRRRTRLCNLALAEGTAARLRERCHAVGATVNGAYAAAAVGAARALGAPSGLSCASTVDLRPYCEPPLGRERIGAAIGSVAVPCDLEGFDPWTFAKRYPEATRAATARGEATELVGVRLNRLQEWFVLDRLPRLWAGRFTGVGLVNVPPAEAIAFPGFELEEVYAATSQHVLGNALSVLFLTVGATSCLSFAWVEPLTDRKRAEGWAHQTCATLEAMADGRL